MDKRTHTIDRLVALAMGELPASQRERVERELNDSPAMREQYLEIRELLRTLKEDDTVEPPVDLVERVVQLLKPAAAARVSVWRDRAEWILAQLTFDSRRQPALAGFRGRSERYHLGFTGELGDAGTSVRIDLQVTPPDPPDRRPGPSQGRNFRMRGQIASSTDEHPRGVRLLEAGTEDVLEETVPDERGRFQLHLEGGTYRLAIAFDRTTLLIPDVKVE